MTCIHDGISLEPFVTKVEVWHWGEYCNGEKEVGLRSCVNFQNWLQKNNTIIPKQELGECIPPPIRKFLAPPNRKSMRQSRSLMIFLYPDYEVNEAENRKGSKLHRSPYC